MCWVCLWNTIAMACRLIWVVYSVEVEGCAVVSKSQSAECDNWCPIVFCCLVPWCLLKCRWNQGVRYSSCVLCIHPFSVPVNLQSVSSLIFKVSSGFSSPVNPECPFIHIIDTTVPTAFSSANNFRIQKIIRSNWLPGFCILCSALRLSVQMITLWVCGCRFFWIFLKPKYNARIFAVNIDKLFWSLYTLWVPVCGLYTTHPTPWSVFDSSVHNLYQFGNVV